MTDEEIARKIRAFFRTVDEEAALLDPAHVSLVAVVPDRENSPRPVGAYAMLTNIGYRDNEEADHQCWENLTVAGQPRVAETKVRSVALKFRVDVYAKNPSVYTKLFQAALRSSKAADLYPLVVRRIDGTMMSPELIQQIWEDRAAFNVEFAMLVSERVLIEVAETGDIAINSARAPGVITY